MPGLLPIMSYGQHYRKYLYCRSLAASAPVLWFGDMTPCNSYYYTVTQDFARESDQCVDNIRDSWAVMTEMGKTRQ